MAVDVIDEIAIRLVADGTDALDEADRIIDELEEKGKEAGEAYGQAWSRAFQREYVAGGAVSNMAKEHMETFKEAADYIASLDWFPEFDAAELARFAEAFEMVGGEKAMEWAFSEKTAGMMTRTNDLMSEFANIVVATAPKVEELGEAVSDETVPATEELSERFKELIDYSKELGLVLDTKTAKSLKEITDAMDVLEAEGGDVSKRFEDIKADMREQAENMLMAERQVWKVVDAYREMGIAIPNALQRDKIRAHVKQLQKYADRFSDVKAEADRFTDSLIKQGKAAKANQGILGKLGGIAQGLGFSLGGLVTGVSAAVVGFKILKGIVNEVRDATRFALEFTDTTRDLTAAIRVNSIAGTENTMTYSEWLRVAEEVSDVANAKLIASYESVSMALRDLGAGTELHDEQIQDLVLAGARWSKIYGEELPGGLRKLTQFINTGYGQSLKQLGFDLDKVAQNQKALNMGLGTNVDKLSESQQEMVRYALLMEELEKRTEGVAIETGTFADRLDKADKQAERAKKTLGDLFVPISVKMKEFWADVKTGFTVVMQFIVLGTQELIAMGLSHLIALAAGIRYVLERIGEEGFWDDMKALPDVMKAVQEQAAFELLQFQIEQTTGATDELTRASEGATGAVGRLGDEIGATAKEVEIFMKEARKFDEGMAQITRRLNQAILDIEDQFRQRRAKSEVNTQRALRDIDYDASVDRLEALRDFQIDEIRMREDHQKDIYQLEERFLLDLEDAVRNRDARQVLQLQRRFNLEKKSREEDFNLRTKRRKEDLSFELQDIAFARAMRRQDRILAFNEEMDDLAAQESLRKEQVRLRAKRQGDELLEQIKNRLLALTEAADGELAIQKELLDALVGALNATYGENGPWVKSYKGAVKIAQTAAEGIARANQQIVDNFIGTGQSVAEYFADIYAALEQADALRAGLSAGSNVFAEAIYGTDYTRSAPTRRTTRRQRGGTVFATSPTDLIAGEGRRPERVDITPLSQSTGKPSAGFRSAGDKISIDLNVEASEMLKVEVADHTMGEIADVYVNITQRGFQGGRGA